MAKPDGWIEDAGPAGSLQVSNYISNYKVIGTYVIGPRRFSRPDVRWRLFVGRFREKPRDRAR